VASIVVSTVAFFVFSYFIKRWADDNGIPKGMTRSLSVFILALAAAYAVAWMVDLVVT
jgi:hypothetical protein